MRPALPQAPGQPVHGALERGQPRGLHGVRVDEEPPAWGAITRRASTSTSRHAGLVQVLEHVERVGGGEGALAEGQAAQVAEHEVHVARRRRAGRRARRRCPPRARRARARRAPSCRRRSRGRARSSPGCRSSMRRIMSAFTRAESSGGAVASRAGAPGTRGRRSACPTRPSAAAQVDIALRAHHRIAMRRSTRRRSASASARRAAPCRGRRRRRPRAAA